ncbi:unnamed protein product [Rhodiola kirilowii]
MNFSGLIDKFWNKTEGWKAKNLSTGGKEILIKSVLQALPQYAMNCFQFPDDTIQKMHSSIRRFWWSNSTSKKPIHWVKAQALTRDKDMGGLGFKDLKCINLAFLAKQAWRIYNQPDLLIPKMYKAKYCHNYDMLYCSVGYRPSFCWRSIVKGFELLRAGSCHEQNGTISWTANPSGVFDLKSAYNLMLQGQGTNGSQEAGCSDYTQRQKFWKAYWRMAVPRKVKIFGWRGYQKALPVGISLFNRGLTNNVGCVECGYRIETYAHVFLHCWFAKAYWDLLGIPEMSRLPESVGFADIIHFSQNTFPNKKKQLILVSLWFLWYNRNKLKHGESSYSLNELVFKATSISRSFEQLECKFLSSMRFLYISEFDWKKPPAGFIKINSDASWKDAREASIGIVARDSDGKILAVRAIQRTSIQSSNTCEGMGLLECFRLAECLKADRVIFESDCAEAVQWINICPNPCVAQQDWFKESLHLLHRHMEWKVFLIRREANIVADHLAKRVTNQNWCWTRLDCCPHLPCFSS